MRQEPQVVEKDLGQQVQEERPKAMAPVQSAPPVAPTQPKGDIVIRAGYDPKTTKKAKVVQGDIEYLISPLTGTKSWTLQKLIIETSLLAQTTGYFRRTSARIEDGRTHAYWFVRSGLG